MSAPADYVDEQIRQREIMRAHAEARLLPTVTALLANAWRLARALVEKIEYNMDNSELGVSPEHVQAYLLFGDEVERISTAQQLLVGLYQSLFPDCILAPHWITEVFEYETAYHLHYSLAGHHLIDEHPVRLYEAAVHGLNNLLGGQLHVLHGAVELSAHRSAPRPFQLVS